MSVHVRSTPPGPHRHRGRRVQGHRPHDREHVRFASSERDSRPLLPCRSPALSLASLIPRRPTPPRLSSRRARLCFVSPQLLSRLCVASAMCPDRSPPVHVPSPAAATWTSTAASTDCSTRTTHGGETTTCRRTSRRANLRKFRGAREGKGVGAAGATSRSGRGDSGASLPAMAQRRPLTASALWCSPLSLLPSAPLSQGEQFQPSELDLRSSQTEPPALLTEARETAQRGTTQHNKALICAAVPCTHSADAPAVRRRADGPPVPHGLPRHRHGRHHGQSHPQGA